MSDRYRIQINLKIKAQFHRLQGPPMKVEAHRMNTSKRLYLSLNHKKEIRIVINLSRMRGSSTSYKISHRFRNDAEAKHHFKNNQSFSYCYVYLG